MATDTSAGFQYMGREGKGKDWIQELTFKDTETLTRGDIVNLESGEVDLGATNDSGFLGIALETKAGTDSTTKIWCHVAPDAIYSVYDPNVRALGDKLDLTGTTGAQTVTTSSNADFIVVGGLGADERTLVMFTAAETWLKR
ncbi:MAG: hypothetical protein BroJett033_7960 [Chloroflexota bacterium]|nr:MAG: hypothetical protein BroJett033_7960 [Chloroflexota bacterium]